MKFQRGFKAAANSLALEVREELSLEKESPLCPWALADHLQIPVVPLTKLIQNDPEIAGHVDYLARREPKSFSAMTVFDGTRRCIVHNHAHAKTRQRSNISHEIAHALLMHPPHPPFCEDGKRAYDPELESEAGWLGPVLLVSNEAARWAAFQGFDEYKAADHFGVSLELMRFRLRMSGATNMARRMRRK